VSCQGNFNTNNGTNYLCAESVQMLLDECQTCVPALLPFVTPFQFANGVSIRVFQSAGCFAFHLRALAAEQGPPVIVNTTVVTSGGGASNNPNNFPFIATLIAEIRNGQVPYGGEVSCISPSGKPGNPKKLTSNDFVRLGNGNWQVAATCKFGPKVPRSLWNWFLRIDNTNSSAVSDNVAATQFEVNSDYVPPGGNFGVVLLCEARNAAEILNALGVAAFGLSSGQRADDVTCCDPDSKCTVSGLGTGILIGILRSGPSTLDLSSFVGTIINLILSAGSEGLLLSGGSTISITGALTCASKVFGQDASSMTFPPGASMQASQGCLLDLSTITINFTANSAAGPGVIVRAMPGDNPTEPSLEIQQLLAGAGTMLILAPFQIEAGVFITINGMPSAVIIEFRFGITFLNPADPNNGNAGMILITGGVVFGSSHAGWILQLQPQQLEPPPATRATTQPNGASVVICNGPGNAVAGNARVSAGEHTGVFIRPKNAGDADCGILRRFKIIPSPTNLNGFDPPNDANAQGWLINSYFGFEFGAGNPWADYPTPAQQQIVRLEIKNNARLVIVNAKQGGAFSVVYGAVKFDQGSIIEVELAQSNVASTAFEIVLMRYQTSFRCINPPTAASCSSEQCDVDATLVVSNPIANRPATMICRTYKLANPNSAVPTGWKELVLQFPAAPVITPPSASVLPFVSTITAIIVMDRSITDYPVERFLAAIFNILGISPAEIQVDAYVATESTRRQTGDRIRATFHCRSSVSVEDANAKCQRILNEANTPGSALANELRTISTGQKNDREGDDNGSDEALYGLFALAAIPIICIVILCLCLKNRKRQADNQYMQDTATFSNVAAQPQPINYPYPYYDPAVPAQALAYDGKAPSAIMPPPAYPQYGY
jgi:hypothetical protein